MTSVDEDAWAAAALRLFDDEYVLVATGPRTRTDWRIDALAVMNRRAEDPRGWLSLDWDREGREENPSRRPSFPFLEPSVELLRQRLYPVTPETASALLVAMTDDWCELANVPDFAENKESLLADAGTLLARFGPRYDCYTNVTDAKSTQSPDLLRKSPGWISLTEYTADYGLVVVADEEIGLFWSFNPI
ncbi:hypothetical protein AB0M39_24360 [Streptomyces sp. NPDC051907]|uniref:hypothetical protein n=1 Tax=Streptomyces sp. NPDC051907 TaxID=3155284 RepID=UPI00341DB656